MGGFETFSVAGIGTTVAEDCLKQIFENDTSSGVDLGPYGALSDSTSEALFMGSHASDH